VRLRERIRKEKVNKKGGGIVFTKGIILSETEYRMLWSDFAEMLRERIEELDEEEREELLKDREEFEEWVKDQIVEMFEAVLEDNDVEAAVIYLKDEWRYVPDGEEFYYMSYGKGYVPNVIKELEKELKGNVKESKRRYYKGRI
jgi:hypothetical protein